MNRLEDDPPMAGQAALWCLPALRWLLILIGSVLMTAVVPMCFPLDWMATIHRWLGLGELPTDPIVVYLARSTSLLYATHGTILLVTGIKLPQSLFLTPWIGWLHVAFGIAMFIIDLTAPMPLYWIAGEGLPVAVGGAIVVWLAKKSQFQLRRQP